LTVNAGAVPPGHWTRDPEIGGGRIVGEACHFIDLLRFLTGSPIVSHQVGAARTPDACVTVSLRFEDGSTGTVHYFSSGHRSFPKERLDVFCGGRVLQLDNFRVLRGFGWSGFKSMRLWRQDKGQRACVAAFVDAIRQGKPSPIPLAELLEVARVTLAVSAAAHA
jgi:predicted dehydrogenase